MSKPTPPCDPEKQEPRDDSPANEQRALRIGLLLDSLEVRVWVYEMLGQILAENLASIELLVLNTTPQPSTDNGSSGLKRVTGALANRTAALINNVYVDRDHSVESAVTVRSLDELLPNAEILEVATRRTKHCDYLPDDAIDAIQDQNLDILFRVGFRIIKGGVLQAARHGVWSYHHGDNRVNRGGPPCYWEVMEAWPEVGSTLQVLNEDLDNGLVLYRSTTPVFPFSLHNTRNRLYWKSSSFLPRVLCELRDYPETFYERVQQRQTPARFYSERLYRDPTPAQSLKLSIQRAARKVRTTYQRRVRMEQWILLFDLQKPGGNQGPGTTMWRYRELLPPKDRCWADPHVIARNGKFYVFFEELPYSTMKGHLSVIEIDKDGKATAPVTVLEKDHHLSYPGLIEHDDELWMVPESNQNKTVDLYRCTRFPDQWEHHTTLLQDQNLVDATLYFYKQRWWLFGNIANHRAMHEHGWDELHLFYSDDLQSGDWTAHPLNPIVSDIKCSRPAGPLFERNGKLYRPSQNCAFNYGYGFNISEIDLLDTVSYKETLIEKVTPQWRPDYLGTHTISHAHDGEHTLSVSDACKVRRRLG